MALRVYTKEYYSAKKQAAHFFSYISLTVGAMMLFWSAYPFISFEIYSRLFIQRNIASPVSAGRAINSLADASSVLGSYNVYSSNLRDFVQADLWFPSKPQTAPPAKIDIKEYSISIPKLNIVNAKVSVGGTDLAHSLVHYLPTTLPGENGNVAIFGHSALPYNYDPKDYHKIFTFLPSLEKGDKIFAKVGDKTYEYEAFDIFIVTPDQVSILDQKYDAAYMTVVTCVPPGATTNRLVVRSKLVNTL
ncbi:MAG: sortase [Patescibacteria group bacterium]